MSSDLAGSRAGSLPGARRSASVDGAPLRCALSATKLGLLASLYFAQGLPFGFFTQALQVIMRQRGLPLSMISPATLLALPWALKFLWAPVIDRYGGGRLGRRRGWIVPLQLGAVVTIALLGVCGPDRMALLLVGVFVANWLAATQDIATDALAVDLLSDSERGLGNGIQVAGYRVGMIAGGGVLLIFLERIGWPRAFFYMAGALLLSTVPIWLYREPPGPAAPASPLSGAEYLRAAGEFLRRPGARGWLLILFLYKAGEALAGGMLRTFLVDAGFGLEDVGWILGTVGFTTGLVGALLGGVLVNRLGRRRALVLFGLLQVVSVLSYSWAAATGAQRRALYGVCALEHLCSGMATAALFTAMMDVSRPQTGATDYTLQACMVVLATLAAASVSGPLAQGLGYAGHFALSGGLCLAAVGVVLVYGSCWDRLRRATALEAPSASSTAT